MIAQTGTVGIDVSKARLDVFLAGTGESLSLEHSGDGIARLIRRLAGLGPVAIGVEASGGYERPLIHRLAEAGFTVYLLDPAQVRLYARSMKRHAKTDRLDAMMIAFYLQAAQDNLVAFTPDRQRTRLAELLAHRRRQLAEAGALKGQYERTDDPLVRRLMRADLRRLDRQILLLDKEIRQRIAASRAMAARAAGLTAVKGVGPVLAATLLASLPELGVISAKRIASLVGVAPHARQSGRIDRGGRCSGGRKEIRDVLYMAALSAIKARDPELEPFYRRLRAAGKPFKVAIVAAMRKLITRLNAIARDQAIPNAA